MATPARNRCQVGMLQSGVACDEVREYWGVAVAVLEWYVTERQQAKSVDDDGSQR